MGSKSQRQKERHTRKRQEKRKAQKQSQSPARRPEIQRHDDVPLGSNARHRQRLSQQTPRAWPDETLEDVAVFDDSALSALPSELAEQVSAIRAALQDACESRGEVAVGRLSVISRGSPLSEWRLFIRGLVDWLAEDAEAANEAWKRLNPERRPGRIATAMMVALRSDLEDVSHSQGTGEPCDESQSPSWNRWDDQLLYHAKLLRRVRFDRAAIRIAEAGLSVPEESRELLLGPKKLQWLRRFVAEYGETEPDLAAALSQVALGRAFAQEFGNLFEEAAKLFQGPRHDPRNRLLSFFYFSRFADDSVAEKKAEWLLDKYLKEDLPRNEALSAPLRGAIASQIHLNEALSLMQSDRGGGMISLMFGPPENPKAIREHLRAAVKADSSNRPAHEAYVEWVESKLDDDRLAKPKRKPLEDELAAAMSSWSKALPEDVEPRLWLVDHLLENECLEDAKPHVDFLAASRLDDPRVRATPWKWQLLEAMRLCRRKAWLADVPARLDEAEKLWPAWLPKQWLPYLRAAATLRSGRTEAFEDQRRQICEESGRGRDSLADACMMLGAAQQMRVPATDLAPLRAALDGVLKRLGGLPLDELLEAGGFFWDLQRIQLLYPAYRMHGKNIGKALLAQLAKASRLVLEGMNDERIHKAFLWCSEHRFWPDNYEIKWPPCYKETAIQRHPIFAAARLNAYLRGRYHWRSEEYRELGPMLREAAQLQRDAYYRYWFVALADEFDDVLATDSMRFFGFPFGNAFGTGHEDDSEDDEGDDLDFDPNCNCATCQAAKRAAQKSQPF